MIILGNMRNFQFYIFETFSKLVGSCDFEKGFLKPWECKLGTTHSTKNITIGTRAKNIQIFRLWSI